MCFLPNHLTQNALNDTLIAPNAPPCRNRPQLMRSRLSIDTPNENITHPMVDADVHKINDFEVPILKWIGVNLYSQDVRTEVTYVWSDYHRDWAELIGCMLWIQWMFEYLVLCILISSADRLLWIWRIYWQLSSQTLSRKHMIALSILIAGLLQHWIS